MSISYPFPTVNDVTLFKPEGPYQTKSGGELTKVFELNFAHLSETLLYWSHGRPEQGRRPTPDLRGLRLYRVVAIPQGVIGANEFHRLRTEIIMVHSGRFLLEWFDLYGEKKSVELGLNEAILIPSYLLHRYTALEPHSALTVLANTTFDATRPETHDSYSADEFQELLAKHRH